jgi:hypothetical protein
MVSLTKNLPVSFHAVHMNDSTKRTKTYASPKNVIKFGMRKPDMPAGQFHIVKTEAGVESIVLTAYKTV